MINYDSNPILFNCSEVINDKLIWIYDSKLTGLSEICDKTTGQLKIINHKSLNIDFLKIDGCAIKDNSTRRCDCLISTSQKIVFVEFKELENFDNIKSRRKKRKDAIEQLEKSINYFKTFDIDLNITYGLVVVTPKTPHNYSQPITTYKQKGFAEFFKKTGCANLIEGNLIEF